LRVQGWLKQVETINQGHRRLFGEQAAALADKGTVVGVPTREDVAAHPVQPSPILCATDSPRRHQPWAKRLRRGQPWSARTGRRLTLRLCGGRIGYWWDRMRGLSVFCLDQMNVSVLAQRLCSTRCGVHHKHALGSSAISEL